MSHTGHDDLDRFLSGLPGNLQPLVDELARCTRAVDMAWATCEFAGRTLGLADCVVYLTDPGGATVSQHAAWGPKRVADRVFENRIRLRLGVGVVGTCALTGAPQLVSDTRLDRRYVVDEGGGLSELAVPVLDGPDVRGVIDTEHPRADHFTSRHVRALLALAAPLAVALRRATD